MRNAAAASLDWAFFCPRIANIASGSSKVTAAMARRRYKHVPRPMRHAHEDGGKQEKRFERSRRTMCSKRFRPKMAARRSRSGIRHTHEHGASIGEGASGDHPGPSEPALSCREIEKLRRQRPASVTLLSCLRSSCLSLLGKLRPGFLDPPCPHPDALWMACSLIPSSSFAVSYDRHRDASGTYVLCTSSAVSLRLSRPLSVSLSGREVLTWLCTAVHIQVAAEHARGRPFSLLVSVVEATQPIVRGTLGASIDILVLRNYRRNPRAMPFQIGSPSWRVMPSEHLVECHWKIQFGSSNGMHFT